MNKVIGAIFAGVVLAAATCGSMGNARASTTTPLGITFTQCSDGWCRVYSCTTSLPGGNGGGCTVIRTYRDYREEN